MFLMFFYFKFPASASHTPPRRLVSPKTPFPNPLFSQTANSPISNPPHNLEHLCKKSLTTALFCIILWS